MYHVPFTKLYLCRMSGPASVLMSYMSELFGAKRRDSVVMVVGLFQSIGGCLQPRKFTKYTINTELLC